MQIITKYYDFEPKSYNNPNGKIKISQNSFEFIEDVPFGANKINKLTFVNSYKDILGEIITLSYENNFETNRNIFINLTKNKFFNKLKLKFIFKLFWFQKNYKYLIGTIISLISIYLTFKQ